MRGNRQQYSYVAVVLLFTVWTRTSAESTVLAVSSSDCVLTIAGIAALTGYWAIGAVTGVIAIAVAAVLLVTGTTQKCPINEAVGVDTTPEDTE